LPVTWSCQTNVQLFILTLLEEFDWNYICPDNTQQSALLAFVSRYIWKQERWPWTQLLFQFRTSLWVYWIIFPNIENSTNGKTFLLLYAISPVIGDFFPSAICSASKRSDIFSPQTLY
jgi:hypothetical protein